MTYVRILFLCLISFAAFSQTIDQYKTTTAAGSVNAYTIPNSDFGAYRTNEKWLVDFTGVTTNSGAATLNRFGLGAKSIKMPDGTDVTSGTLTGRVQISYNGTVFYVVGGSGSGTWGSITGTLSSQTDLQSALNAKLSTTLTAGHIYVGNVSNVATDVAMSGDATLSSSGALSIGAGKVTNTMLAGSIADSKLSLTSNSGILKSNGSAISAAVSGTDYLSPSGSGSALSGVWLLGSGGTLTGSNTITSNTMGWLNFAGTSTATANNQSHLSITPEITSRSTASDNINTLNIGGSITAASTSIDASPLLINTSFKTNSGISTGVSTGLQNGSTIYISKTTAGMTSGTYTSVAPASTSGSGTSALFTVIVASATTFTSFNCTTSGSGYNVGETVTFNGSQFGSGSGSITLAIVSTLNSNSGASLQVITALPEYAGITVPIFNAQSSLTGSSLFNISASSTQYSSGNNVSGITLSDVTGTFLQTNVSTGSTTVTLGGGRPLTFSSSSISSGTALWAFSGQVTFNNIVTNTGSTWNVNSNGYLMFTGTSQYANTSGVVRANIYSSGGVTTGVPTTYTVSAAGSGYSAGTKTTTGGTGSGAQVSITVSGGGIVTAAPISSVPGTGYTAGDVLAVVGGTGGTVTIATIDQYGGIMSFAADSRSLTDAKSNNIYPSYYSAPTYTLASSSTSTWFGYYNPTYTSFGSGTKGGIAIVPTGTVSGFGTASPAATIDVRGSGSTNPAVRIASGGTSTEYSFRVQQSDVTTDIFWIKGNGDFQAGLSTSKWGMFGTSAVVQQSVLGVLINNVTSGGTTSTIANFTDLSTYSNDAATIRNNDYQLAKKLLAIETALRNYGIIKD